MTGAADNPLRLAAALAERRAPFGATGIGAIAVAATLLAAAAYVALAGQRAAPGPTATALAVWRAQPLLVFVLTAVAGALTCARRRRQLQIDHAQGWLAALPIADRDISRAIAARVTRRMLAMGCVLELALAAVLLWSRVAAAILLPLLAVALAGWGIGGALGWRMGARHPGVRPGRATLSRARPARLQFGARAGLAALGIWPFAQMLAMLQPRWHAKLLAALLLSLPVGTPGWLALKLMALLGLAIALGDLIRAAFTILPRALAWLQATPLSAGQVARSVLLPAFTAAMFGVTMLAWLLVALGVSWLQVGIAAALFALALALAMWIGFVVQRGSRLGGSRP